MDTKYNWKEKREKRAFLALADGTVYRGHSVGALKDCLGEVVFNTGMTGYQEILSDPSYNGQIVTMTYTEMGNYGMSMQDMESRACFANGFIVHQMNEPSSWRSELSLRDFLIRNSIPAIAGIDTRALTSKLRDAGTLRGYISVEQKVGEEEAIQKAKEWKALTGRIMHARVSCAAPYEWDPDGKLTATWGIADRAAAC